MSLGDVTLTYDPENPINVDDSSELTKFARSILGSAPVQYLAQTVDKPGRAIRGLLAGKPEELLNLLPLSDTFGWTDPNNTVSGRDLLRQYGVAGPEDTWGNFFGGMAAEIILDPTNVLTGPLKSLTKAGADAAKIGVGVAGGLERTMMGRLGAGQAGLVGVRSPWWYDLTAGAMGAPTGNKALLTGAAGQKVLEGAGALSQGVRDLIDTTAFGRGITGAYDTAGAYLRSAFIPGSGIAPDARTTPIIAEYMNPAVAKAREATLDPLTRAIAPMADAVDLLAAKGITGPDAQRLIGKAHAMAVQGVDPTLWKPAQDAEGAMLRELAGTLEPSVQATRELTDSIRDLRVKAGADIGINENPWGLNYNPAATIEGKVAKNAVKKGKVVPQNVLQGGQVQMDELLRDSPITGIMNEPIPAGMDAAQVMKARRKAVLAWAEQHAASVEEAATKKFGAFIEDITPPAPAAAATAAQPATPSVDMSGLKKRFDEVYGPNSKSTGTETTVRIEQGPGAGTVYDVPGDTPLNSLRADKPLTELQQKAAKYRDKIKGMTEDEFTAYAQSLPQAKMDRAVSIRYDLEELARQRNTYGSDQLRNAEAGTNVNAIGNYSGGSQSILDDMIRGREAELAAKEFADAERQGLIPKPAEPTPAPAGPATPPTPKTWKQTIDDALAEGEAKMAREDAAQAAKANPRPDSLMPDAVKKSSIDLAEILAGVSPEVKAAKGYYRFDPIAQLTGAVREGSAEVGRGQATMAAIASNVVNRSDEAFRANPAAFMRLDKAMNKMNLVGKDIEVLADGTQVYTQGARHSLMQHLKEQGLTSLDVTTPTSTRQIGRELKKLMIPKDLVPKLAEEFKGPSGALSTGLLGKVREYGDTLRSWMTQPWVAFHGRNLGEGLMQTQLTTGATLKDYMDVVNYARGAIKDPALAKEMADYTARAVASGAAHQGQIKELMGKSVVNQAEKGAMPFVPQGEGKSAATVVKDFYSGYNPKVMAERGEKWATLNPRENVIVQQGMRMSSAADDAQRMAQFVSLKRKGYSDMAAADLVSQTHLDYSALTPFEQQLRNVIPFYSFSRRNLARTAAQAQDPGALVSLLRAGSQGGDTYMPSYITQGTAAAIPGAEEGKQRYVSGLSTPFDDEAMGAIIALAQGNLGEAGKRAFSTTSPLLKLAATLGTGRELYSGRRLDEYTPSGVAGLLPNYAGNVLSQFASATPAGRLLSTVNTAIGGKDTNILARLALGIRTTDVDTEMASAMAARDAVNQALRRTGMVATTESLYPKKDYREDPPERLAALLELMGQIRQHGADVSAARQP